MDQIGSALFDVGHFNCAACGRQWTACPVTDCFGLNPLCACAQYSGWLPYVSVLERVQQVMNEPRADQAAGVRS